MDETFSLTKSHSTEMKIWFLVSRLVWFLKNGHSTINVVYVVFYCHSRHLSGSSVLFLGSLEILERKDRPACCLCSTAPTKET